ncbi:MAG: RNA chaperone Hfq [Sphingomicrobium sp.]
MPPTAAKSLSLQDYFLNAARKSKGAVTVYLLKGVKLQGIITWFDAFSLLLRRDRQTQLVYKHSISTILPSKPLNLDDVAPREAASKAALQDSFLSAAARAQENMTIFLVNGVMLQGCVAVHDQFSLLLERSGQVQLIYKHAISTIQPDNPLSLGGEETEDRGSK